MIEPTLPESGIRACFQQVPVLKSVLAELDQSDLAMLEEHVRWVGVSGGTTLFEQGEAGHDIFALLRGRLGIMVDRGLGSRLVHHVEPGELVGEMALISREPRSATVIALRDCEFLCIPGIVAERLLAVSHALVTFLLGQAVDRLKSTTIGRTNSAGSEDVAVLPLGEMALDRDDVAAIGLGFQALRGRAEIVEQGDGLEVSPVGAAFRVMLSRDRASLWARRIVRQADRTLFVAHAGSRPDAHAKKVLDALAHQNRSADLMLINPPGTVRPSGAAAWLGHFAPDQVFHVAKANAADHARVARLVSGKAIGVVLAGGGARGFAHIGALRALADAGIPVDMICGTSMGALIGGSFAVELDLATVTRNFHHSFVLNRPIGDYTLPIISLSRGRRMSMLLRHHFGDVRIEDCWRNFFCVSSNLSTGTAQIHNEGSLWRALRASSSLPGIVPPVIEGNDVLVDGGLMNNFPVDLMVATSRGKVIGIDVSAGTVFRAEETEIESKSLRWMLGRGRHEVPNIFKLLMRSGLVASNFRAETNSKMADLLIRPDLGTVDLLSFDRYEEAIEAGYRSTRVVLDALPSPLF